VIGIFSKCLLFCILISSLSHASAILGLDYILFTDKNTVEANTSSSSNKSMYVFNLGFTINQKKSFYFGWSVYSVITKDETNNQFSNYTTQDMGPSFRYEFGRGGWYFLSFIYGIRTQTSFDTGGTEETWLGTNYLFQAGVSPELSESFHVVFAFNYFHGGSTKKLVSDTQTDVTYSKAFMTPTLGVTYKW
tara:strand:- start:41223 stop:41795 length:573 start_codon:yes stop_codon:yes gene_type:complete